jgi:hypothetical protein
VRILTVRQPWAWAIIHGGKTVENRPRNIAGGYRGPVAIHAGKNFDYERPSDRFLAEYARRPIAGRETGFIIGVVDLVDVHLSKPSSSNTHTGQPVCFDDHTRVGHVCSSWAQEFAAPGGFHLVLANPRPLTEAIPYTGALGLRDLGTRDPATVLAINRQIGTLS